jgi:hypothetical protein
MTEIIEMKKRKGKTCIKEGDPSNQVMTKSEPEPQAKKEKKREKKERRKESEFLKFAMRAGRETTKGTRNVIKKDEG